MVQRKPWKFFIIRFIAGGKKHTVRAGAADLKDAHEGIIDMYSDDRTLQIISSVESLEES